MPSRSLGHRAPLLWVALPLAAGVVGGRLIDLRRVDLTLAVAAAAALVALVAAWRPAPRWLWPVALVVALTAAGAAGFQLERRRLERWDTLPPREVRVSLRVERLFAAQDPRKASGLGRIVATEPGRRELLRQRIYFSCALRPGDPPVQRSAVVTVVGVLVPLPAQAAPDSFDGYLASCGVNFRLVRGRIVALEQPAHAYYRFCDTAAARFREILGCGIAPKRPTLAGLLRAMMLGETRELTEDQHAIFMQSGTMHLFAISGLNIAVIATALEALLLLARLPPWVRFACGVPLLWLFVDITGAAPSAVRAFAMAVFFRGAFVLRRPANTLAAVVGSAALVLVLSPLQVFSASFLMSYVIVLALLVMGVPLGEAWTERVRPWRDVPKATWTRWQRFTADALTATASTLAIGIATSLVSTVTSVQFFKLLTPGALAANLVLIPAAMFVTLGGFASLLAGLVGLMPIAALFNHASAIVLLVIEALVRGSVRVPGAFVAAEFRAPWVAGAALAALLASLLVGYAGNWQRRCGGWWPPFAVVALTLAFGVKFG